MLRIEKYLTNKYVESVTDPHECDDAKTSMSEIVKRFFHNEPIPVYDQNEVYDYMDETITHNNIHLDKDGHPIKDRNGNILFDESLNMDIINMIPIHPNAEDIDPHGDNSSLLHNYEVANEKLGAFQRVQAQKIADAKESARQSAIDVAIENGYVKSEE